MSLLNCEERSARLTQILTLSLTPQDRSLFFQTCTEENLMSTGLISGGFRSVAGQQDRGFVSQMTWFWISPH